MGVHRLDLAEARRIAVRAQMLDAPRPRDLLTVVHQLTLLQVDPTVVIAPNADLVAWSRIGPSYQPAHLQQALEQDRSLFERDAMVRPMSDLGGRRVGQVAHRLPADRRVRVEQPVDDGHFSDPTRSHEL